MHQEPPIERQDVVRGPDLFRAITSGLNDAAYWSSFLATSHLLASAGFGSTVARRDSSRRPPTADPPKSPRTEHGMLGSSPATGQNAATTVFGATTVAATSRGGTTSGETPAERFRVVITRIATRKARYPDTRNQNHPGWTNGYRDGQVKVPRVREQEPQL